ncbi:MAG TPA: GvpL/GvpF family gas vesicle protein [Yinghuangia sp.]|uniref:GvpL/GvpF family gas vesicle protein n=1 Tax=Yinghuangia sp. YIM S10712 TaxID=3436930 RepID=UPI002B93AC4E|nr:GvpL/GvpF family gas vesicle protein [Yinghuangia sp.]
MSSLPDDRPTASYVYAVCRPFDTATLDAVAGIGGGPVHTVAADGLDDLVAVVETVPVETFGEEALQQRLTDPPELERIARAHNDVVQTVGASAATAPLRLATMYHDDDGVRNVLRTEADRLRSTLEEVAGHTEWSVKVYGTVSAEAASRAPRRAGATGSGAGRAYLDRRRNERAAAERARAELLRTVSELDAALRTVADQVRHLPLRPPSADAGSKPGEANMLNAACLVADERVDAFGAELTRWTLPGLRVEVGGPWVPYSFTGPDRRETDQPETGGSDPGQPSATTAGSEAPGTAGFGGAPEPGRLGEPSREAAP